MNFVPYINAYFTLGETVCSFIGYGLPEKYSHISEAAIKYRRIQAAVQLISGVALVALAMIAQYYGYGSGVGCADITAQAISLGIHFVDHALFSLLRSVLEQFKLGKLTLLYDFNGVKFIPALSPKFDLNNRCFIWIKSATQRLITASFFPPALVIS